MKIELEINKEKFQADLSQPIDLSIPLRGSSDNPTAWYVSPPTIEPVRTDQFTGSVAEGGSVNFRNIFFNPHGHGTHTECLGHISKEVYSINKVLTRFFFLAELITIKPTIIENGDQIILWEQVKSARKHKDVEALIIRTIPNSSEKLSHQYSATNPPYVEAAAMTELINEGIKHFLIDLPSVDKEIDGGALAAHHAFWEYPEKTNLERTITELIYVPESTADGKYLLNLQISSFENDASPSKPVLFKLEEKI